MAMTRDDIQGGLVKGMYPAAPTKPKPKPASSYSFVGGMPAYPNVGGVGTGAASIGSTVAARSPSGPSVPGSLPGSVGAGVYAGATDPAVFPNPAPPGPVASGTVTVDTGASGAANTPSMDPQVLINQLLERMGIGSVDAQLKADREKALIAWGDPALASQAGFGLDPQAGVFAQQNYLSGNAGLARLDKNKDLAKKAVINKLAARGTLRSGDLGYLNQQEDQTYGNQRYDATQQLLSYLTQVAQQAQDRKNALRQSVINSVMQAYQNYAQNPQAYTSLFGG